jgi:hypothetical protein
MKTKEKLICSVCGTEDMFITLNNGEKLPQYAYSIATNKVSCMPCKEGKNVSK